MFWLTNTLMWAVTKGYQYFDVGSDKG